MKKLSLLLSSIIIFMSCSNTDDDSTVDPDPTPAACNVIQVSGNISEPTTWKEGNVYVINGADVRVISELTIEPGVIVKLKNSSLEVANGKIIAVGTPQKRIVFTSLADDRYCGDTNGNGNTSPSKGDWVEIHLNGASETTFQYVDIFYAGDYSGGSSNAVRVSGPGATRFNFDNCRIAHTLYTDSSYDTSCAFYGSYHMKDANISKFTNNAFYDNGKPIHFSSFYNLDPSNKFHNPENPTQTNTHNGIYLYFTGSPSGSTVNWNNTEVPYVLEQLCHVFSPATVNIGPNTIVKFKNPSDGLQRSAYQNINLHPTAILTSYKDDTHGGDTNGDGNNSTPTIGDWKGLFNYFGQNPHYEISPNILYAANQ